MTQEYKELLFKDLSSRLPYGVKASYYGAEEECETWDEVEGIVNDYVEIGQYSLPIEAVKPYLFPLSSMTKEQKEEYNSIIYNDIELHCERYYDVIDIDAFEILMDFYHEHHFDYRGLIPNGLAIDATSLNIY